jgi:hypothetical protein
VRKFTVTISDQQRDSILGSLINEAMTTGLKANRAKDEAKAEKLLARSRDVMDAWHAIVNGTEESDTVRQGISVRVPHLGVLWLGGSYHVMNTWVEDRWIDQTWVLSSVKCEASGAFTIFLMYPKGHELHGHTVDFPISAIAAMDRIG